MDYKKLLDIEKKTYEDLIKNKENKQKLSELEDKFEKEYVYCAIKLEGSNKARQEGVNRILNNQTVKLSEREIKEIKNQLKALRKVNTLVKQKKQLNDEIVKDIHEILVKNIMPSGYRTVNIQIPGASKQPTDHLKIYDRIERLFYNASKYDDPIEKAIYIHADYAKIHPFLDANGRLSRLILNYVLMLNGYLPIKISPNIKEKYFGCLDDFKITKKIDSFIEFIYKLLIDRYKQTNKLLQN